MHPFRTHTCGELRAQHIGLKVRLSGWVHHKRDFGSVLFVILRDHYGLTQVLVKKESPFFQIAVDVKSDSVVIVTGEVISRGDQINPEMPTGEIEVEAHDFLIESSAKTLPFMVSVDEDVPEEMRLRYRFLDLRKTRLHQNIIMRSKICQKMRDYLNARGFHEFHTPILTSSSPEGARDYLVPSRIHPGKFYALPQAPQQFKQLLMISGFDRYFQIAPCFRDEDARADRSPGEFYQLDLEMSYCTQEDIFNVVEDLMIELFRSLSRKEILSIPFPRIPYRDAMARFGSDKPDLRFGLEIVDVTPAFRGTNFEVFAQIIESQGEVKAIRIIAGAKNSRRFFDEADGYAKKEGGSGVAWLSLQSGKLKGTLTKFVFDEGRAKLRELTGFEEGDALLFTAGKREEVQKSLGKLRLWLGDRFGLRDRNKLAFCWITDFPMYEWDEEKKCYQFCHNPFSMPQGGMEALNTKAPLDILAYQYDIVCNGIELSSGAIRNHRPEIMIRAFEIAGYSREVVETKFPALWNAFHYGAPPHGGIAPGIDRIAMIISDETNIREVIAFPLNQQAQDLLMGAPSEITEEQLKEVHIQLRNPRKARE